MRHSTAYILGAVVLILAVLVMISFSSRNTEAAEAASVTGYAWSDTIGWISLGGVSYGLSVGTDGVISGYAWSDNIGWVSANASDLSGCPSGACEARLSHGVLSGWLRALSGTGEEVAGETQQIFLTSGNSWTVPSDWNSSNNTIEVIGGGGGGSGATDTPGAGGGGGAYAKVTNVTLTSGASIAYAVGLGGSRGTGSQSGSSGGDTYLCDSTTGCGSITGSNVVVGAKGGSGGSPGPANGSGGAAASGVGTVRYSGGNGGLGYGGAGGGGAGGPHGAGGNGATSNSNCFCNVAGPGGGGGGGGSGGSSGSGETGGAGGANHVGAGAGSGGNTQSIAIDNATAGGGGGGGGYEGGGATGGTGTEWNATHGAGGGGGGSGNSNWSSPHNGGHGGLYGGGGGSGGRQRLGPASSGGNGAQGIIVITYTPTSPSESGGWDGWISLKGSEYGPTVTDGNFSGYAWGSTVVGWVDFSNAETTFDDSCTPVYACSGQDITYTDASCNTSTVASCISPSFCSAGSSACLFAPLTFVAEGEFTGHLLVSPLLVPRGLPVTVRWNLENAASCTISGNGRTWTTTSSAGENGGAVNQQTTFTLFCTGLDGSTVSENQTVNILPIFIEN